MRSKSLLLNPARAGARRRSAAGSGNSPPDYNCYTYDPDALVSDSDAAYDSAPECWSHPSNGSIPAFHAAVNDDGDDGGSSGSGSGSGGGSDKSKRKQPVWTSAVPVHFRAQKHRTTRNRIAAAVWLGLAYSVASELVGMVRSGAKMTEGGGEGMKPTAAGSSRRRSQDVMYDADGTDYRHGSRTDSAGGNKYHGEHGSGGEYREESCCAEGAAARGGVPSGGIGLGGGGIGAGVGGGNVIDRRMSSGGGVSVATKTASYGPQPPSPLHGTRSVGSYGAEGSPEFAIIGGGGRERQGGYARYGVRSATEKDLATYNDQYNLAATSGGVAVGVKGGGGDRYGLRGGGDLGGNNEGGSSIVKSLEEKISKLESQLERLGDETKRTNARNDRSEGKADATDLLRNALRNSDGRKVTITFSDDERVVLGGEGISPGAVKSAAVRHDHDGDMDVDDAGGPPKLAGLTCPSFSSFGGSVGGGDWRGGGIGKRPLPPPPTTDESVLSDLVYWDDVPSDEPYLSPFHSSVRERRYLTFEPDVGGWNNARMVLETVLVLAHATGRTLVLPPRFVVGRLEHAYDYLGGRGGGGKYGREDGNNRNKGWKYSKVDAAAPTSEGRTRSLTTEQNEGAEKPIGVGGIETGDGQGRKNARSYEDFFHLDRLDREYAGIDIITMDEFLQREGRTFPSLPPDGGRTDWNDASEAARNAHDLPLWSYLREMGAATDWLPGECVVAFPAKGNYGTPELKSTMEGILRRRDGRSFPDSLDFQGRPTPVNYPPVERLREMLAGRTKLCPYEPEHQSAKLLHLTNSGPHRLLVQWYAFVYFEDWRHDLWAKRLIRDHLRYRDEIFCAAGRVIEAIRQRAWYRNQEGNPNGEYDALHIRRGDFARQYPEAMSSAESVLATTRELGGRGTTAKRRGKKKTAGGDKSSIFSPRSTVYVATDERDESYLEPLRAEYDIVRLSDFADALGTDVDPAQYGMIEQIVLSRARAFAGTYFSTFSAYVHRLRGFYAARDRRRSSRAGGGDREGGGGEGGGGSSVLAPPRQSDDDGSLAGSYYHGPKQARNEMRTYRAVRRPFWHREFPTAWRDVDRGVGELRWEGW